MHLFIRPLQINFLILVLQVILQTCGRAAGTGSSPVADQFFFLTTTDSLKCIRLLKAQKYMSFFIFSRYFGLVSTVLTLSGNVAHSLIMDQQLMDLLEKNRLASGGIVH